MFETTRKIYEIITLERWRKELDVLEEYHIRELNKSLRKLGILFTILTPIAFIITMPEVLMADNVPIPISFFAGWLVIIAFILLSLFSYLAMPQIMDHMLIKGIIIKDAHLLNVGFSESGNILTKICKIIVKVVVVNSWAIYMIAIAAFMEFILGQVLEEGISVTDLIIGTIYWSAIPAFFLLAWIINMLLLINMTLISGKYGGLYLFQILYIGVVIGSYLAIWNLLSFISEKAENIQFDYLIKFGFMVIIFSLMAVIIISLFKWIEKRLMQNTDLNHKNIF